MLRLSNPLSVIIRVAIAVALLTAGFAHRPAVGEMSAPDLAIYALPDGSLPDICLTGSDGDPDGDASKKCEFCRWAASAAVLPPRALPLWILGGGYLIAIVRDEPIRREVLVAAASPRGPPLNS